MPNDKEIVDWLCDHATVIGYLDDDGISHYDKVEGADICFRDMVLEAMKNENGEYFKVTSLHKNDLRDLVKNDCYGCDDSPERRKEVLTIIDNLTDVEMKTLASKLSDDYCNQLYWSSLELTFASLYLEK